MSYRPFVHAGSAKSFDCVCAPSETLVLIDSLRPRILFSSIEMFVKKYALET